MRPTTANAAVSASRSGCAARLAAVERCRSGKGVWTWTRSASAPFVPVWRWFGPWVHLLLQRSVRYVARRVSPGKYFVVYQSACARSGSCNPVVARTPLPDSHSGGGVGRALLRQSHQVPGNRRENEDKRAPVAFRHCNQARESEEQLGPWVITWQADRHHERSQQYVDGSMLLDLGRDRHIESRYGNQVGSHRQDRARHNEGHPQTQYLAIRHLTPRSARACSVAGSNTSFQPTGRGHSVSLGRRAMTGRSFAVHTKESGKPPAAPGGTHQHQPHGNGDSNEADLDESEFGQPE